MLVSLWCVQRGARESSGIAFRPHEHAPLSYTGIDSHDELTHWLHDAVAAVEL